MTEVPPSEHGRHGRPATPRTERRGWLSRPKTKPPLADQEAEVRARLYARPAPTQRTVERVQPVARPIADRPAA